MFALLLLVHNAAGKDTQKDVPTIQPIVSCPDVGYYFKRDVNPNSIGPGPCNLCFCQDNSTALCWPRDSSRCDPKRYSYYGKRKRENREKRSPAFTDIFFRDAAREVFHRQSPEQCKPYESSFSEGCPPADWCIGCTVCDCDANGRWDCHILSFCPDKKGKQVLKKKRQSQRSRRQLSKKKQIVKTTKKPSKSLTKKPSKTIKKSNKNVVKQSKVKVNTKPQLKNSKNNYHKTSANKKGNAKRASPLKKTKKPFQNKKVPPKKKIPNKKIQQSKKSTSAKTKPVPVKKRNNFDPSETVKYTKMILNKVMDSVNKVVNETQKSFQKDKSLKKSSSSKHKNNMYNKYEDNNGKKISKWHPTKSMPSIRKEKRARRKRHVIIEREIQKDIISTSSPVIDEIFISSSKFNINQSLSVAPLSNDTSKIKYFEYNIDSKHDASTKNSNKSGEITMLSNGLQINVTRTENTSVVPDIKQTTSSIKKSTCNRSQNMIWNISLNEVNANENKSCGKLCELRRAFKTFVLNIGRRNMTKTNDNKKNIDVMTYFRNFFNRLLRISKTKKSSLTKKRPNRKHNIIRSLCKNLKSCKYNPMDRNLQSKIEQLRLESKNILKSVRIIKGLLKLIENEGKKNKKYTAVLKNNENKDIVILNAILKNKYDIVANYINLTETQLTQINYIRDNTRVFIQSIEKFAHTLNDIISILTNENKEVTRKRKLRCTKKNDLIIDKNNTVEEKIQKLKKMLINYNLAQNRFMKGMFDVLNTLEQKAKPKNSYKVSDNTSKYNDTLAIDTYAKNVIKNLRKLKDLAEKLSFKNRQKRTIIDDDDAIDYFLMLIEYLLKQNRPLDVSPGDGIDILIEAIKNAPDIKSVHKVVFHNDTVETNENVIATTETRLAATFYNVNKNMEKIHFQQVNDSVKEFDSMDADEGYADIYDNKTYHQKELKVNRFFDIEVTEKVIDTTMEPKVYVANNDEEKINIILDRYDTDKGDDKRGFEVFTDDTDEEGPIISSSRAPEVETEMDIEAVTHKMPKRTTMPPQVTETSEKHSVPDAKSDKQANLDWTELENSSREEERRDVVERKRSTTQTPTQLATRTLKKAAHKYPEPTSSSSREDEEAQAKTVNPEYLMRKKQLNLLNSLDYETEKSVIDAESKEDKYNSEVFSFM
ncbi:uncharacterized protein LOC116775380 isoform X2 [Danaus plexippus]|uniref:uncharacterized protein LOC116775380 isoform X2 n=1 Tax=Danaus plexippus TaxID=13037 RepID=UPI002AB0A674|nr:uncharacterized protein LOC116775380 isoform X2 [Danaus plexippus]